MVRGDRRGVRFMGGAGGTVVAAEVRSNPDDERWKPPADVVRRWDESFNIVYIHTHTLGNKSNHTRGLRRWVCSVSRLGGESRAMEGRVLC